MLSFAYWRNLEYYTYWWVDGYPNVNTNNETGYGLRKFMNPVADIKNWIGTSSNYPLFRLAELYLIKAEALNEYYESPNQDVYDAINEVRSRVEMPDLPIVSEDNTKLACVNVFVMNGVWNFSLKGIVFGMYVVGRLVISVLEFLTIG